MRRTFSILLTLSLVLAGCKAKEVIDQARISKDLDKKGTIGLMKEVANDRYDAPKDGKLTDAQVQMYLKVRDREKAIAVEARKEAEQHAAAADKAGDKSIAGVLESMKTMSAAANMLTADIRAAKDLGYNTQEYLWVKGQILAASTAAFSEKTAQAVDAQMNASQAQMKKAYDEAKDDQTRQMYKQMLDGYEKTKAESKAEISTDPALAYNRQLISKYENALAAILNESTKYEEKADAQRSAQELEKKLDSAGQEAKKP